MKRIITLSAAMLFSLSVLRSEEVYLEDELLVESSEIQDDARIAFSNSKSMPGGVGDVIICPGTGYICLIKTAQKDAEGNVH